MALADYHITCDTCLRGFVLRLDSAKLNRWRDGEYVTDVFPTLDPNIRELMVTGRCGWCLDRWLASLGGTSEVKQTTVN
jgi:hypothetical protein